MNKSKSIYVNIVSRSQTLPLHIRYVQAMNHRCKTIASMTKQHPFAISKNLKNIQKIKDKEPQIKKFYQELIVLDNSIKTGKVPDSYFRL